MNKDFYTAYLYQEESNSFLVYYLSLADINRDIEIKSRGVNERFNEIHTETSSGNFDRILEINEQLIEILKCRVSEYIDIL